MQMNQLEFDFLNDQDHPEELTTVILYGIPIKEYSISKGGNVYSHMKQKRGNDKNGFNTIFDKSHKKLLKPYICKKGYAYVDIRFDCGTFDYDYRVRRDGDKKQVITCRVHKLVIDSWKPFDDNLPAEITKEDYKNTPESIRSFLRELFIINHIDHNKSNNRLDNLERVTHKQNSRAAIKHYGSLDEN